MRHFEKVSFASNCVLEDSVTVYAMTDEFVIRMHAKDMHGEDCIESFCYAIAEEAEGRDDLCVHEMLDPHTSAVCTISDAVEQEALSLIADWRARNKRAI